MANFEITLVTHQFLIEFKMTFTIRQTEQRSTTALAVLFGPWNTASLIYLSLLVIFDFSFSLRILQFDACSVESLIVLTCWKDTKALTRLYRFLQYALWKRKKQQMLLLFAIKYQVFVIIDLWTSYNVEIVKHDGAAHRARIRKKHVITKSLAARWPRRDWGDNCDAYIWEHIHCSDVILHEPCMKPDTGLFWSRRWQTAWLQQEADRSFRAAAVPCNCCCDAFLTVNIFVTENVGRNSEQIVSQKYSQLTLYAKYWTGLVLN